MKKLAPPKHIILIVLSSLCLGFYSVEVLSPAQKRGKSIYTKGVKLSGEKIDAIASGARIDAKYLPCSNCHGMRGEGIPEGGVVPSPLDWSNLTKPYSVGFDNGRIRGAYDAQSFKKAIVEGLDPNGNRLSQVMPSYILNDDDVEDLIEYLKIIKVEAVPGLLENEMHLGIILPGDSDHNALTTATIKTIRAYLDLVNSNGGVYHRKIVLHEFLYHRNVDNHKEGLIDFLNAQGIFAFIGSDLSGLSDNAIRHLEGESIPVVGLIDGFPRSDDYIRNEFYYLFHGRDQAVEDWIKYMSQGRSIQWHEVTVVGVQGDDRWVDKGKLDARINFVSWNKSAELLEDVVDFKFMRQSGDEHYFVAGDWSVVQSIASSMKNAQWYADILYVGNRSATNLETIPTELDSKIFSAHPLLSFEPHVNALDQYHNMSTAYGISDVDKSYQYLGLSSTIIFTESLKIVGRNLDREGLLSALDEVYNFETGFMRPMTYGPNKRIGVNKIYLSKVDLTRNIFVSLD